MINKPNFLLIVVDEERYPPLYDRLERFPGQHGRPNQQWKFSRYFDNEQFWSEPGVRDVTIQLFGEVPACHITCKTKPVPEQYELYNLTEDPLEIRNLAHPSWATVSGQP